MCFFQNSLRHRRNNDMEAGASRSDVGMNDGVESSFYPFDIACRTCYWASCEGSIEDKGLKDDTTCIVVDIIPPDNSEQPSAPPKKQSKLRALFSRMMCRSSANKLSKKHSAVGIVEELFEEGSAMLAERRYMQEPISWCTPIKQDFNYVAFVFVQRKQDRRARAQIVTRITVGI